MTIVIALPPPPSIQLPQLREEGEVYELAVPATHAESANCSLMGAGLAWRNRKMGLALELFLGAAESLRVVAEAYQAAGESAESSDDADEALKYYAYAAAGFTAAAEAVDACELAGKYSRELGDTSGLCADDDPDNEIDEFEQIYSSVVGAKVFH